MANGETIADPRYQLARLEGQLAGLRDRVQRIEPVVDRLMPIPEQMAESREWQRQFETATREWQRQFDAKFQTTLDRLAESERQKQQLTLQQSALETTRAQNRTYLLFAIIGALVGVAGLMLALINLASRR